MMLFARMTIVLLIWILSKTTFSHPFQIESGLRQFGLKDMLSTMLFFVGWPILRGLKLLIISMSEAWVLPSRAVFAPESHKHLFFTCSFSWHIIRAVIPNGHFFLMEPVLSKVLNYGDNLEHNVISRTYFLIVSIAVYMIWRERNNRMFKSK